MGCLVGGFVITVLAGYTFLPLALVGIVMMAIGWKHIVSGSRD